MYIYKKQPLKAMKTIIVSTDYSAPANNALDYAVALARSCKAKLVIFNSLEPPTPTSTASLAVPGVYKLLQENKKKLEKLAVRISSDYGIMVESFTNVSYVDEELEKLVRRHKADLVVMGMGGDSLDRRLFGSVTTSVIRHAKFPVLVIPEKATFLGLDRILFACDYKFVPKPCQLEVLRDIALKFRAEVQFLHIEPKGEIPVKAADSFSGNNTSSLEEAMDGLLHSYREIKEQDKTEGIKRGIREFQADMLVMIPHHTGFFDFVFNRSLTRKMAFNTQIPLLAIPWSVSPEHSTLSDIINPKEEEETAAGFSAVD